MYKLVQGKIGELEGLLNAATAEGYTQLFREFHAPFILDPATGAPSSGDVYSFMMKKPDSPPEVAKMIGEYAGAFREMMVSLGLGDRLGPPGGKATVLDLVRPPPDGAPAPAPPSD